ncbi:MAG: ABC transporter ATP-binding protein [Cetobacterium sp.]
MKVKNLFYKHKSDFSIENLNFEIQKGEILGILGSNGSGKTTLIKNILGILKGDGHISFENKDLQKLPLNRRDNIISYVPQDSGINNLTVFDTVMLGRIPHMGYKETIKDIQFVDDILKDFNLENFKTRKMNSLSGGERQRSYIARAIAQNSEVLILDEPTSSLDIANAISILKIIKKIVKEKNIRSIIIIHDLNLASNFCDKFLFLKNGKQIFFGKKEDCFEKEIINNLYDLEMDIHKTENTILVAPKIK